MRWGRVGLESMRINLVLKVSGGCSPSSYGERGPSHCGAKSLLSAVASRRPLGLTSLDSGQLPPSPLHSSARPLPAVFVSLSRISDHIITTTTFCLLLRSRTYLLICTSHSYFPQHVSPYILNILCSQLNTLELETSLHRFGAISSRILMDQKQQRRARDEEEDADDDLGEGIGTVNTKSGGIRNGTGRGRGEDEVDEDSDFDM